MRTITSILSLCMVLDNSVLFADDAKQSARSLVNWGSLDGVLQDNGLPAGWVAYPPGFERYDCFAVLDDFHSAPRGLRLSAEAAWASIIAGQEPLARGTRQAARAWVKVHPGTVGEALLRIDYLNAGGQTVGSSPTVTLQASDASQTGAWKLMAVEASSAAFPQATRFQLVAAQRGGGTTVWDDFDLRQFTDTSATNLLGNGDFEQLAGDDFPGWKLFMTAAVAVVLKPVTAETQGGWISAGMTGEAKSAVLSTNRLPIESGKAYRLSGWHRAVAGTGQFKLVFWNDGMHIATVRSTKPARPEWSASDDVVAPAEMIRGATHVTVEYEVLGKFDVAVDAIRLRAE